MKYLNSVLFGLLSITYLQLSSCDFNEDTSARGQPSKPKIISDVTIDTVREKSMRQITELLGIGNISDKPEGKEIRIWYNDMSTHGKIVVIKNDQGWQSSEYDYVGTVGDDFNVVSLEKNVKSKEPSSGWASLLEKLADLGIYDLKRAKDIPDYTSCMDGDAVAVEILKDSSIQRYFYHCFLIAADESKEVKKVKNICLLIQKEFGYELLPENYYDKKR